MAHVSEYWGHVETASIFEGHSVAVLGQMCKAVGVKSSGHKSVLIERLEPFKDSDKIRRWLNPQ